MTWLSPTVDEWPTNEDIAEVLDQAHDILLADGWCQHKLHQETGEHCSVGAISETTRWRYAIKIAAESALAEHLGLPRSTRWHLACERIIPWNDAPGRTIDDVLDAFRGAAKDLRNKEQ